MLDKTMNQADIYTQVKKIHESFDSIVPEALLTDSQRRWRTIASVFKFITPVRQIYSVAVDPLSANPEKIEKIFKSAQSAVLKDSRIISRNTPASKVAELLRVDSVRETVLTHFSRSEIDHFSNLKI